MTYWTSRKKIHDTAELLEAAKQCVENQAEVRIDAEGNLNALRHDLRTGLKSADQFSGELGGRYAGLDGRVELSIDTKLNQLVLKPKGARLVDTSGDRWTELEVAAFLQEFRGSFTGTKSYFPTVPIETFKESLKQIGWDMTSYSTKPNGRVDFIADRIEEDSKSAERQLFSKIQESQSDKDKKIEEELKKLMADPDINPDAE
jgi:hypothetical protein